MSSSSTEANHTIDLALYCRQLTEVPGFNFPQFLLLRKYKTVVIRFKHALPYTVRIQPSFQIIFNSPEIVVA